MPDKNSIDVEINEEFWQNSLNFLSTLEQKEFLSE